MTGVTTAPCPLPPAPAHCPLPTARCHCPVYWACAGRDVFARVIHVDLHTMTCHTPCTRIDCTCMSLHSVTEPTHKRTPGVPSTELHPHVLHELCVVVTAALVGGRAAVDFRRCVWWHDKAQQRGFVTPTSARGSLAVIQSKQIHGCMFQS